MRRMPHRVNSGYSLIELLASAVILVSVASLSLELYSGFNRVRLDAETSIEHSRQFTEIEAAFREQVNAASSHLLEFEGISANDTTLILQHGPGAVTVFRGDNEAGALSESRWKKDVDAWTCDYVRAYQVPNARFAFNHLHPRLFRLQIQPGHRNHKMAYPASFDIVAAIRRGSQS